MGSTTQWMRRCWARNPWVRRARWALSESHNNTIGPRSWRSSACTKLITRAAPVDILIRIQAKQATHAGSPRAYAQCGNGADFSVVAGAMVDLRRVRLQRPTAAQQRGHQKERCCEPAKSRTSPISESLRRFVARQRHTMQLPNRMPCVLLTADAVNQAIKRRKGLRARAFMEP